MTYIYIHGACVHGLTRRCACARACGMPVGVDSYLCACIRVCVYVAALNKRVGAQGVLAHTLVSITGVSSHPTQPSLGSQHQLTRSDRLMGSESGR